MVSDPIAELKSPQGALISMYLERPSPGGFAALFSDLGRKVKARATTRSRPVEKSVDADLRRAKELTERFEVESFPAYALFMAEINGIFEVKALAHPVSSVSVLGSQPYLRPLRSMPRPIRTGILIADRSQARVFVGFDGSVEEIGEPLTADIGKPNFGGFGGYDEHNVRARAQEVASRLWREAGERLLLRHQDAPLDLMLIGGHGETIEDIRAGLHPYLADLPYATAQVGPAEATTPRLRSELRAQRDEFRKRRETELVEHLLEESARSGRGLVGLTPVISAANAQAISDLVVAGTFQKSGTLCPHCDHIDRLGAQCAVCGSETHKVDDIVAALMDATVASGGSVHQVLIGSALDRHGVGALTRFPVATNP